MSKFKILFICLVEPYNCYDWPIWFVLSNSVSSPHASIGPVFNGSTKSLKKKKRFSFFSGRCLSSSANYKREQRVLRFVLSKSFYGFCSRYFCNSIEVCIVNLILRSLWQIFKNLEKLEFFSILISSLKLDRCILSVGFDLRCVLPASD